MLSPVTMYMGVRPEMTSETYYTLMIVFTVLGLLIAVATLSKK
jgi:hypothetical protein